jgi:hypothetical protein
MKTLLARLLKILDLGDSTTTAGKVWNIMVSVGVAIGFAVSIFCKIGIPVPGVPCAQVGEVVERAEEAGQLPETAPTPAQEEAQ